MIVSVPYPLRQHGSGVSRERRQAFVSGGTAAFGTEAWSQASQWQSVLDTLFRSVYLGDRLDTNLSTLASVLEDADEEGLELAEAVAPMTRMLAHRLLMELPNELQPDEISVDPDGEIAFDWLGPDRNHFALSVGVPGVIAFAGVFNGNSVVGQAEYAGSSIPQEVLNNILSVR